MVTNVTKENITYVNRHNETNSIIYKCNKRWLFVQELVGIHLSIFSSRNIAARSSSALGLSWILNFFI